MSLQTSTEHDLETIKHGVGLCVVLLIAITIVLVLIASGTVTLSVAG